MAIIVKPTPAIVPYSKRPVPKKLPELVSFLAGEHGNIQRAIPPRRIRTVTVATDAPTSQDFTVLYDATAAAITVTLPAPDQVQNALFNLKKIDASGHAITIVGTVDGVVNPTLATQYKSVTIQSDGTAYYKLAAV